MYKLSKEALMDIVYEHISKLEKYDIASVGETFINELNDDKYITIPVEMNKIKVVHVDDIRYLHHPKKSIAKLHLLSGETIGCCITADALWSYLEDKFKYFKVLDSALLVNLHTIRWYCSDMYRIYFSKDNFMSINGTAIKKIVVNELGKEKDINSNRSKLLETEYYPLGNKA